MKPILVVLLIMLFSLKGVSQRGCGSYEPPLEYFDAIPGLQQIKEQTEFFIEDYMRAEKLQSQPGVLQGEIIIPVFVHVIYNKSRKAEEDVPDTLVNLILTQLNLDFAGKNTDIDKVSDAFVPLLAGDCLIRFKLLAIQHYPTDNEVFNVPDKYEDTADLIKYTSQGGHDAVGPDHILNIWIGNISGYGSGDGLLGYGNFPNTYSTAVDGVVIDYSVCMNWHDGSAYDRGRTFTHEVGHWLNLYHLWGPYAASSCQSDEVDDTPYQESPHFDCPTGKLDDCYDTDNGCVYMNYLDYVCDSCMVMFTKDQKSRMRACFAPNGPRAAFLMANASQNSNVLNSINTLDVDIPAFTDITVSDSDNIIEWAKVSGAQTYKLVFKDLTNVDSLASTYEFDRNKGDISELMEEGKLYQVELQVQLKAKVNGKQAILKGSSIFIAK